MKVFDPTFNVHPVAFSVAFLIEQYVGVENKISNRIETSPFYNGRERGICLTLFKEYQPVKAIVFGECRNSDSIFVDTFVPKSRMNPPTLADFTENDYNNRKYFSYNAHLEVAKYIAELIEEVFNEVSP